MYFIRMLLTLVLMMPPRQLVRADLVESWKLLNDKLSNYTKEFRPLFNQSKAVDVYLAFDLISIQDFDEREGKLTVTCAVTCVWTDEIFTWNPDEYGGVVDIIIKADKIWLPHMTHANPVTEMRRLDEDWHLLHVFHTGEVTYVGGGVFSTSCPIDVTDYPWDRQYCEIWLMAWGYSRAHVNLIHLRQTLGLTYYKGNGAWAIVGTQTGEMLDLATFGFLLERKPLFVVINLLSPVVFMSFMNVLIFLIPPESGERISYSITVQLAIAVFLTLLGDNLPKTSNPMSILSFYLLSILIVSLCITLVNIISIRLYYTDDKKEVGSFWRRFTMITTWHCRSKERNQKKRNTEVSFELSNVSRDTAAPYIATITLDKVTHESHKKEIISDIKTSAINVEITWKDVSCALDKISFLVFLLSLIVLTVVFTLLIT